MATLSHSEVLRELNESRELLESKMRAPITGFCYPWGRYTDEARRLVALALAPQPGDRHEGRAGQAEAVLRLGIFLAGELEEGRGRHQAAVALVEAAAFGVAGSAAATTLPIYETTSNTLAVVVRSRGLHSGA